MTRTKLTFGPPDVIVERRPDGAIMARSPHALGSYPRALTDWLDHWAARRARPRVSRRARGRDMAHGHLRRCAPVGAQRRARLDRSRAFVERPVAILSGNSVDHALVGLGAMIAGVPYAPVSPPYSLIAKDFAKLKAIIALLTPGLVFVGDGAPFGAAIEAAVPRDVEVVAREPAWRHARRRRWRRSSRSPPGPRSTPRRRRSGRIRSRSSCSLRARPARPRASSTPIA